MSWAYPPPPTSRLTAATARPSFEYIKQANPDLLYVINRDTAVGTEGSAANPILDNELVQSTSAAKNNKVINLDPAGWYTVGYGLNNVKAMVNAVAASVA